ncbi:FUSC family protein [Mucilaginibacter sp. X5P1]|uniref:FUSC family protein n=1 Tax=Mucilaginibacter sp. X5P1 TaxID=2723088 RepID=UPI00160D43F9|nr:FUSC family protein [Mucilaginibacter sp. X5P1]MBB6137360.1 uncharacterized membrane protein YgaE (UPF0421/DUF939 family) [Mucilaginibacter sp. X5P1]
MNKNFFELDKSVYLSHILYLIKVILGVIICYILYKSIPEYPFYWSLVSVVIATSLDRSTDQAYDRIKANILGCIVGASLYPIQLPELLVMCIGVTIIVFLAIGFKITSTLRSALAALIIILLQAETTKHWYIALERVVCVVTGCVVALLLTLFFNKIWPKAMHVKMTKEV